MALLTAALVLIIGLSVVAVNGDGQKTVQDKPRTPEELGFVSKAVLCELTQNVKGKEEIHTWLYCEENTQKLKVVTLAREDRNLDWFYVESCDPNKLSSQFYIKKEELTQRPNKVTLFTISESSDRKEECQYSEYSLNEQQVKFEGGGNCRPVRDKKLSDIKEKRVVDLEPFRECRHFTEWVKTYIDGYRAPDFWPVPDGNEKAALKISIDIKRNRLLTCTSQANKQPLKLICLQEQNVHATGWDNWEYWVYLNQGDNRLQRVSVKDCQELFIKKSIFPLEKYDGPDNKLGLTVVIVQPDNYCKRISYTCKGIWYCPRTEEISECSKIFSTWSTNKWTCTVPNDGQATTANPSTNAGESNRPMFMLSYIKKLENEKTIPIEKFSPMQWWPNDMDQSTGEPKNLLACKSEVGNFKYKLVCLQEPSGPGPRGGEGIDKNHFYVYITESNHRLATVRVRSCYENFITTTIFPKKNEHRYIAFGSMNKEYCFLKSYICSAGQPCYHVPLPTKCPTEESDLTDYVLWNECTGPLSAKAIGKPKEKPPLKAIQDETFTSFPIEIL